MPVRTSLNPKALDRAAARAFRKTVNQVESELTRAFDKPVWDWDGQTQRRNGEVAGSPRNIVDSGKLRDSQQPAQYTGPLNAQVVWTAPHAPAVFLGAVYRTRQYSLPARNLPRRVLNELDLGRIFQQRLAEEL